MWQIKLQANIYNVTLTFWSPLSIFSRSFYLVFLYVFKYYFLENFPNVVYLICCWISGFFLKWIMMLIWPCFEVAMLHNWTLTNLGQSIIGEGYHIHSFANPSLVTLPDARFQEKKSPMTGVPCSLSHIANNIHF
jgi:hypothetical protein